MSTSSTASSGNANDDALHLFSSTTTNVAATTTSDGALKNNDRSEETREEQLSKRPKRKVAIIFGYIGERYCGLQWNHMPDYPTVEEELLRALYYTGMISKENYEQEKVQQKINWERASRTDKGVHALRNVISVSIMLPFAKGSTKEYDTEEARRLLIAALPQDIIVYEIVPVTRSFNAYMSCGARKYEYYLPTFALMTHDEYCKNYFPPAVAPSRPTLADVGFPGVTSVSRSAMEKTTRNRAAPGTKRSRREKEDEVPNRTSDESGNTTMEEDDSCVQPDQSRQEEVGKKRSTGDSNGNDTVRKFHDSLFEKLLVFYTIPEEVMRHVAQYRLSPQQLEHARNIFRLYEGTHSYHNFTPSARASDASCARYIMSVTVGDPFIIDPADVDVMSTLAHWTPSRFYSPDDERSEQMRQKNEMDIEERRERMREHMLRIYGGAQDEGINSGVGKIGLEVVRIELYGQSFLMNQIRKMVGAVASICTAGLPPEYLRNHLLNKNVRCGVPMVPANGLFLSYLDFQRYNYRLERIQCQGSNGFGKGGVYVDRVNEEAVTEFRRKIVAVVLRNEMVDDKMGRWMRSLRQVLRLALSIELP